MCQRPVYALTRWLGSPVHCRMVFTTKETAMLLEHTVIWVKKKETRRKAERTEEYCDNQERNNGSFN